MAALARWCFAHRMSVLGLWVALLVAVGAASAVFGTSYSDAFDLPGTESTKAQELLQQSLPEVSGDASQIVVHVDKGTVTDPAVKDRIWVDYETACREYRVLSSWKDVFYAAFIFATDGAFCAALDDGFDPPLD